MKTSFVEVYVLVREDNQQYIGVYDTLEKAEKVARAYRVPISVLKEIISLEVPVKLV